MIKLLSRSILPAFAVIAIAGCASQPAPDGALLDKKFEQTAQQYMKFQHEGKVVYCKKEKPITSSIPAVQCLSESELRMQVENLERSRNRVIPEVHATTSSIG